MSKTEKMTFRLYKNNLTGMTVLSECELGLDQYTFIGTTTFEVEKEVKLVEKTIKAYAIVSKNTGSVKVFNRRMLADKYMNSSYGKANYNLVELEGSALVPETEGDFWG